MKQKLKIKIQSKFLKIKNKIKNSRQLAAVLKIILTKIMQINNKLKQFNKKIIKIKKRNKKYRKRKYL